MDKTVNSSIASPLKYSLPSVSELFSWSLSFYRSHFGLIFGILIIPFILSVFQLFATQTESLFLIIFDILSRIIYFVSYLALINAVIEEGQTVSSAYRKGLNLFFPLLG